MEGQVLYPPQPDAARASEEQLKEMKEFKMWQEAVEGEMLHNRTTSQALKRVAKAQASKMEAAARRLATAKWISWLNDGPAAVLGRQHKMTRNAIGWTPNATATEAEQE